MSNFVILHPCQSPVLLPSFAKLATNRTPSTVDVDECEDGFLYAIFPSKMKFEKKLQLEQNFDDSLILGSLTTGPG